MAADPMTIVLSGRWLAFGMNQCQWARLVARDPDLSVGSGTFDYE